MNEEPRVIRLTPEDLRMLQYAVIELRNRFTGDVRSQNRAAAVEAAFALIEEYLDFRENKNDE